MGEQKLKIYILTEGSSEIGFGHITRCLSIYQAFEEKGVRAKFIINGDDSITDLVKSTDYNIFNWLEKREKTFELIKDADVVVIDSYLADKEFYGILSKSVKLPVYIDDNKRIDYPQGVVVNGNIHATDLNYPEKENVIYLLGTKYTPLRKDFWETPEKEIRKNIENIMITFGGDDIRNMTPKILKLLMENFPNLNKNVVIGKGFKNIKEIENIADFKTQLIYYPNAKKMKELMLNADIAISAGGQTIYELARVGVPTISIAVADNQIKSVNKWSEIGFILFAGLWKGADIFENIKRYINVLKTYEKRKKISSIGRKYVDGKGSIRVVEILIKTF